MNFSCQEAQYNNWPKKPLTDAQTEAVFTLQDLLHNLQFRFVLFLAVSYIWNCDFNVNAPLLWNLWISVLHNSHASHCICETIHDSRRNKSKCAHTPSLQHNFLSLFSQPAVHYQVEKVKKKTRWLAFCSYCWHWVMRSQEQWDHSAEGVTEHLYRRIFLYHCSHSSWVTVSNTTL